MKIHSIRDAVEGFAVLDTAKHAQTAIMVLDPQGQSSDQMNVHTDSDQVLLVVEGELHAEVGVGQWDMRKGDSCIVRAGTPHRFVNRGTTRAVTFNVYSPPEYAPEEKG